jgi:hypothetical protein
MEVIDIGLSDLEPVSFNVEEKDVSTPKSGVNFGPGIELLMNDKKISSTSSTNVDLGDLDRLETELNGLSENANSAETSDPTVKKVGGFADFFSFGAKSDAPPPSPAPVDDSGSKLGSATADDVHSTTKTWDGFGKVNDVPTAAPRMNEREKRRKKRAMIKKLEEWYDKGHLKHTSHFNMDSDFDEVEDEYETAMEDKRKKDSVKLQGWWFTTLVNSLEYANAAFDPFGLNLDGWGEQINEDIDSYEEIFAELHDKYKGGKMSPEVSLLLRLGFSGAVLNITNKALSTATPGFNDVIRQSPELMKMFSNATADTMKQSSPGFEFVNSVLHPEEQVDNSFGVPPQPMETKNQGQAPRPGMQYTNHPGNRPDISMGRGSMFNEQGVDISNQHQNISQQQQSSAPPVRAEMKGPQSVDLEGLLSGLKTREVNMHQPTEGGENDSMVSISSLRDAQNGQLPKRTNRRKQRSDKNTISLDI